MTRLPASAGRASLVCSGALLIAIGFGACGRRGPLEPPVEAAAVAPPAAAEPADRRLRPRSGTQTRATASPTTLATRSGEIVADSPDSPEDDDPDEVTQAVSPLPTPRKRSRAYSVPKEPFILDPLL